MESSNDNKFYNSLHLPILFGCRSLDAYTHQSFTLLQLWKIFSFFSTGYISNVFFISDLSFVYDVHIFSQLFPDVGNNTVVISLQDGPLVCGDVKVMFESSAVSQLSILMRYVKINGFFFFFFRFNHACHFPLCPGPSKGI